MAAYNDKRRSVDDILAGIGGNLNWLWDATPAPDDDFEPLPAGVYTSLWTDGKVVEARTGTPSYRVEFTILKGPHANRRLWYHCYLTPKAAGLSKKAFARLGIHRDEQLKQAPPSGRIFEIKVSLRTQDDGTTRNEVRSFRQIGDASLPVNLDADDPDPSRSAGDASFDPDIL